jgi:hypothetical protein
MPCLLHSGEHLLGRDRLECHRCLFRDRNQVKEEHLCYYQCYLRGHQYHFHDLLIKGSCSNATFTVQVGN